MHGVDDALASRIVARRGEDRHPCVCIEFHACVVEVVGAHVVQREPARDRLVRDPPAEHVSVTLHPFREQTAPAEVANYRAAGGEGVGREASVLAHPQASQRPLQVARHGSRSAVHVACWSDNGRKVVPHGDPSARVRAVRRKVSERVVRAFRRSESTVDARLNTHRRPEVRGDEFLPQRRRANCFSCSHRRARSLSEHDVTDVRVPERCGDVSRRLERSSGDVFSACGERARRVLRVRAVYERLFVRRSRRWERYVAAVGVHLPPSVRLGVQRESSGVVGEVLERDVVERRVCRLRHESRQFVGPA